MSAPNSDKFTFTNLCVEKFAYKENGEMDPEGPSCPENKENRDEVISAPDLPDDVYDEDVEEGKKGDTSGQNSENVEVIGDDEGITGSNSKEVNLEGVIKDSPESNAENVNVEGVEVDSPEMLADNVNDVSFEVDPPELHAIDVNVESVEVDPPKLYPVDVNAKDVEENSPNPDSNIPENAEDSMTIEEWPLMDVDDSLNALCKEKQPRVVMQRCDKIWETLQMIRNMQPQTSTKREREEEVEPEVEPARKVAKKSTTKSAYNNDIVSFFSKETNKMMNRCPKCPKIFSEKRGVRRHALTAHHLFIPLERSYVRKAPVPAKKSELRKRRGKAQPPPPPPVKVEPPKPEQASTSRRTSRSAKPQAKLPSQPIQAKNIFEVILSEDPKIRKVKQKVVETPVTPATVIFKCLLCSKLTKDIRNHMIEYHKIPNPDEIIQNFTEKQRNRRSVVEDVPKEEPKKEEPKKQPQRLSSVRATPVYYSALKNKPAISEARANVPLNRNVDGKFVRKQDTKTRKNQPMKRGRAKTVNPKLASQKSRSANGKSGVSQRSANQKRASNNSMSRAGKLAMEELKRRTHDARKNTLVQCNVCLGMYSYSSISRHIRTHTIRGETRQNIHLRSIRYKNALLGVKFDFREREKEKEEETDPEPEPQPNPEIMVEVEPEEEEEEVSSLMASNCGVEPMVSPSESRNSDDSVETICECGRSFRNPHHLYMHKAQCKEPEVGGRTTRSSSDRDSGIGISITIKKKNNSYEVVNNKENANDADNMAKGDSAQSLDQGEVLKLRVAENDVDVDIEDDEEPKRESGDPTEAITTASDATEQVKRPLKLPELTIHTRLTIEDYAKEVRPNLIKQKLPKPRYIPPSRLSKKTLDLNSKPRTFQNLKCSCGKVFKGSRAEKFLDIHGKANHPNSFHCAYCKTDFDSFLQCRRHNCSQIGNCDESIVMRPCPLCQVMINITCPEKFNGHVEECHPDAELPVLCFTCPKRFKDVAQRALHNSKVHLEPPCKICGKKLAYEAMIRHKLFHSGYGYPCHACKFAYMSKSDKQAHQLTHVGKEWKCPMCSKVFKKNSYRILHMKTHHSLSKVCKICKVNISSLRQLEIHIEQKHNQDYPYTTCEGCQMQFVDDEELKKHMKSEGCHTSPNSPEEDTIDIEVI